MKTLAQTLVDEGALCTMGEARRLAAGGGIRVDGAKVTAEALAEPLDPSAELKIGKRVVRGGDGR